MVAQKKSDKRIKKEKYWDRLQMCAGKYNNALFVDANNVSSKQIGQIRMKLREIGACMIMGKNTLMKAALTQANTEPSKDDVDYKEKIKDWHYNANIEKILAQLKGNTNIIFTNGDLGECKHVLDTQVRPSPAKAGMIAPANVSIPAGPTGLDPKQTSYFQTLQIQTKIQKAQIEIVQEKQVIFVGEKVSSTQAALLDKLKIYPFEYKMHVSKVLQDGSVYDANVLNLTSDDIINKFRTGVKHQTSLSLAAGYPTAVSVPHSLLNGFKNMVAVCAETGYSFPFAKKLLDAAQNAPAAGAASTGAAKAGPAKEATPEKVEEVADAGTGNLFGDDDDEY